MRPSVAGRAFSRSSAPVTNALKEEVPSLNAMISELHDLAVNIRSLTEPEIDTTTPSRGERDAECADLSPIWSPSFCC